MNSFTQITKVNTKYKGARIESWRSPPVSVHANDPNGTTEEKSLHRFPNDLDIFARKWMLDISPPEFLLTQDSIF